MTTYFTSDLHIGHKRIVEFTQRGVATTQEEHDDWLINLWNSQVLKGDLVYVLGDVSFAKYDYTKKVLSKLNGQIIVIKGNHDQEEDLERLKDENLIQSWKHYKEIKITGEDGTKYHTCLFHFPITSWHKQGYGSYHLYGHTHGNFQGDGLCLDVGIDNSCNIFGKHKLFSSEDIVNIMRNKEIVIKDHHRKDMTKT